MCFLDGPPPQVNLMYLFGMLGSTSTQRNFLFVCFTYILKSYTCVTLSFSITPLKKYDEGFLFENSRIALVFSSLTSLLQSLIS